MSPVPTAGLASALVQTIDFGINVLRKDCLTYRPTDTATTRADDGTIIQAAIAHLYHLIDLIEQCDLKRLSKEKPPEAKKSTKSDQTTTQLLKLSDSTIQCANSLCDALIAAQIRPQPADAEFDTLRTALLDGVWKKSEVTSTKKKLRSIRRDVDAALLLALRQHLEQFKDPEIPEHLNGDIASLTHLEVWQNGALDAIKEGGWKEKKRRHVEEFGKTVDGLITMEQEKAFVDEILRRLGFEGCASQPSEEEQTGMDWVWSEEMRKDRGLLDWLGSSKGENMFWITGKAGSGKTMLVHHIFRNQRVFDYLEAWSGSAPGISAAFFLSKGRTALQSSAVGLLRSLLYESLQDMIYGPLEQDHGIMKWLFADRWRQYSSYGGGMQAFTFLELNKSFELMVSDVGKKFLFMVDGLDEAEEDAHEIAELLSNAIKRENVKIIVSSRTTPELKNVLEGRPSMRVDQWTSLSIREYVTYELEQAIDGKRSRSNSNSSAHLPTEIAAIISDKAAGDFLWAKLATNILLQRRAEGSSFSTLKFHAQSYPFTLDGLLTYILQGSPLSAGQIWKVHTLLRNKPYPSIHAQKFALDSDNTELLSTTTASPLKSSQLRVHEQELQRFLSVDCYHFFTITTSSSPDDTTSTKRITYTNRDIQGFLSTCRPPSSPAPINTTLRWANAHLRILQSYDSLYTQQASLWTILASAIACALTLFKERKKFPMTYLDSVGSLALAQHTTSGSVVSSDLPSFPSTAQTSLVSFLDLAVLLNITPYISIKLKTVDKQDIQHAQEFDVAMRKRLGQNGLDDGFDILDEAGCTNEAEVLKEWYDKDRTELDALLEYHGKSGKPKSARPVVEEVESF